MTLSIMSFSIIKNEAKYSALWQTIVVLCAVYAECPFMLSVVMLKAVMLSVVAPITFVSLQITLKALT